MLSTLPAGVFFSLALPRRSLHGCSSACEDSPAAPSPVVTLHSRGLHHPFLRARRHNPLIQETLRSRERPSAPWKPSGRSRFRRAVREAPSHPASAVASPRPVATGPSCPRIRVPAEGTAAQPPGFRRAWHRSARFCPAAWRRTRVNWRATRQARTFTLPCLKTGDTGPHIVCEPMPPTSPRDGLGIPSANQHPCVTRVLASPSRARLGRTFGSGQPSPPLASRRNDLDIGAHETGIAGEGRKPLSGRQPRHPEQAQPTQEPGAYSREPSPEGIFRPRAVTVPRGAASRWKRFILTARFGVPDRI